MSFLGAQNSIALGVQGIIAIDTGTGTIAVVTDPYWPFVSTLLHGDGTNAAQNNTFLDGSTNNFTVTRNGNTTQGSFNPFVPTYPYSVATNGGSGYFDGTGDYLTIPNNVAFTLGANDFTIEYWAYFTSLVGGRITSSQSDSAFSLLSFYTGVTATGALDNAILTTVGGTKGPTSSAGSVVINTWTHIAFVRNGNTLRAYVNGVQNGTISVTGLIVQPSTEAIGIGATPYGQSPTAGYISNFRLVNGTCLYPSGTTFTPPTAPLTAVTNTALLLGMSNGAIYDNAMLSNLETVADAQISTSVFKYGTGSMKFDGTGDYLSTPAKTAFVLGSGDFTIEMWAYFNSIASSPWVAQQSSNGANPYSFYMVVNSTGTVQCTVQDASPAFKSLTSGVAITTSNWFHLAFVRDGNTNRLYINGVQNGTVDVTGFTVRTATGDLTIGGGSGGIPFVNGYIDDFRFTKGICRYPGGTTFTPPTAAFPNS